MKSCYLSRAEVIMRFAGCDGQVPRLYQCSGAMIVSATTACAHVIAYGDGLKILIAHIGDRESRRLEAIIALITACVERKSRSLSLFRGG